MRGPVLRFAGAEFRYAGAREAALSLPRLEIDRGELVAVIGPIGSGTTSLLLVSGGFAPRLIGGSLTGTHELNARLPAIVFATPWTQLTGLCSTVLAEVAFGPASHGLPKERVLEVARRQLERLGIAHLATRDPASLSGGELQRVIVAGALALEPDLLLLDDPAAELDPAAADALYHLLREVAAEGTAVMVATPDIERAARVATRTLRLAGGIIVEDRTAGRVPL